MNNSNGQARELQAGVKTWSNLGLTATNSYFINDTELHEFDAKRGYIMYVLEDLVLDTGTVIDISGNSIIGPTFGKGLYHFTISKIKLVSGSAIIYRAP